MANKVKYGLEKVHIWPITFVDGKSVYGKVFRIPGAVNVSFSATGNNDPFYADNVVYHNAISNTGYEGDLEVALIPEEFEIEVLGNIKDDNGAIIEKSDAKQKNFAMGFQFSGDVEETRHVLYNCSATRPNLEGSTKENSATPQTDTLSLVVSPDVETKDVKAKLRSSQVGYDTFFETPYVPVIAETPGA